MTVPAPIPCVIGPTASGKTSIAIEAIRSLGTEAGVVSCDAYAVYRGMPILTAAPTAPSDIPHRLVGILGPDETYDAGRFLTDCDYELKRFREGGRAPWIVGGTALYLRCWLKGMGANVPRSAPYRAELRQLSEQHGREALHARLAKLDPARAAALHPNDLRRVVRALEIIHLTGQPASQQRHEWTGPNRVDARIVALRRTREDLAVRIHARTASMFEAGVLQEVESILEHPLSPEASQVLGLAELREVLKGAMSKDEAAATISRRTLRFARKQMTFFRSFQYTTWIDVEPDEPARTTAKRVIEGLREAPETQPTAP